MRKTEQLWLKKTLNTHINWKKGEIYIHFLVQSKLIHEHNHIEARAPKNEQWMKKKTLNA